MYSFFFFERVLGVLRDDKRTSPHLHMSWIVFCLLLMRIIEFLFFFLLDLYLIDFIGHSDRVSACLFFLLRLYLRDFIGHSDRVSACLFIELYICTSAYMCRENHSESICIILSC
jgi:hypothetical protein